MRRRPLAAEAAKGLLHTASHRMLISDPMEVRELSETLDDCLDFPVGDQLNSRPGYRAFEPEFRETGPNNLAFRMSTGGLHASSADRVESTTRAMRHVVDGNLGRPALKWFDGRSEAMRGSYGPRARGFGAWFSSGIDRGGLSEAAATYEWGPDVMDALPRPLFELAQAVMTALPGLRPFFTTIRCGRAHGSQQITFEVDQVLRLNDLKPLMDRIGLGHQHAGLMSLTAFILGARFSQPPATATITLVRTRRGVEMRLDINLDALPDAPAQLLPLLRLPMTERPKRLQALDRWMTALTPEGYYGPGSVTVLSIRVRPDMPARVALYLRPISLDEPLEVDVEPAEEADITPGSGAGGSGAERLQPAPVAP